MDLGVLRTLENMRLNSSYVEETSEIDYSFVHKDWDTARLSELQDYYGDGGFGRDLIRIGVTNILGTDKIPTLKSDLESTSYVSLPDGFECDKGDYSGYTMNIGLGVAGLTHIGMEYVYAWVMGSLGHECGHLLYTDMLGFSSVKEKLVGSVVESIKLKDPSVIEGRDLVVESFLHQLIMSMYNIIEDARIERALTEDHLKMGDYLEFVNDVIYNYNRRDLEDYDLNSLMQVLLVKVVTGRYPDNYIDFIKGEDGVKFHRTLKDILDSVENIVSVRGFKSTEFYDDLEDILGYMYDYIVVEVDKLPLDEEMQDPDDLGDMFDLGDFMDDLDELGDSGESEGSSDSSGSTGDSNGEELSDTDDSSGNESGSGSDSEHGDDTSNSDSENGDETSNGIDSSDDGASESRDGDSREEGASGGNSEEASEGSNEEGDREDRNVGTGSASENDEDSELGDESKGGSDGDVEDDKGSSEGLNGDSGEGLESDEEFNEGSTGDSEDGDGGITDDTLEENSMSEEELEKEIQEIHDEVEQTNKDDSSASLGERLVDHYREEYNRREKGKRDTRNIDEIRDDVTDNGGKELTKGDKEEDKEIEGKEDSEDRVGSSWEDSKYGELVKDELTNIMGDRLAGEFIDEYSDDIGELVNQLGRDISTDMDDWDFEKGFDYEDDAVIVREVRADQNVLIDTDLNIKGSVLNREMSRLLRNKRVPNLRGQNSGDLDMESLANVRMGDRNIFVRHGVPSEVDYAVSILMDNSGSMDGRNFDLATDALVVLEEGFSDLVSLQIKAFNTDFSYGGTSVVETLIKDYDVRGSSGINYTTIFKEKFSAWGGNADDITIARSRDELLKRRERKKLMIVISDGYPDDIYAVKDEVQGCIDAGIEVVSVLIGAYGIDEDLLDTFKFMYEDCKIVASDPSELLDEIVHILKTVVGR